MVQVELNTIASSFGCLSTLTTQLHTYTLNRLAAAAAAAATNHHQQQQQQQQQQDPQPLLQLLDTSRLPSNEAMAGISRALAAATAAAGGPNAVMVMIVQPGERNAYDQQWLQQTLWEKHGVVTHRISLGEVAESLELRPLQQQQQQQQQQQLVLKSTGQPVGCVYFRAGYTPNDYPTEKEWQVCVWGFWGRGPVVLRRVPGQSGGGKLRHVCSPAMYPACLENI
jgi:glutathione synthase